MSEELKQISSRIIKARERLDELNKTNIGGFTHEQKVQLESDRAEAKIALRRAKLEYEDYIQDEINKP